MTSLLLQYKANIGSKFSAIIMERVSTLTVPLYYRIIYGIKQFFGIYASPTEWIEGLWYLKTGIMLDFNPGLSNFLWNHFDNMLFTVFEDDSTFGMVKALWYGAQGDFSHFTQYWTFSGIEMLGIAPLLIAILP